MCGRFAIISPADELREAFALLEAGPYEPRYNAAPTQLLPVIPNRGERRLELFRWGLIPHWSRDPGIGAKLINARAETLTEKPSFRQAFARQRCLVPANGFYEWKRSGRTKQPYFIRTRAKAPFAFAGLWDCWRGPDTGPLCSFTIVTCAPGPELAQIHDRMPVILPPEAYATWLAAGPQPADELQALLVPFAGEELEVFPVSTAVNSPRSEGPELIRPI
ncbi:MAG: SOS response-associated peptidase [Deltaproteobacteria bacterium]|nr:SOS response-associated peptidase [Deltaproteobacteria bacterium]